MLEGYVEQMRRNLVQLEKLKRGVCRQVSIAQFRMGMRMQESNFGRAGRGWGSVG